MAESGMVITSIESILSTFSTKIHFLQPIYEAIANAFEANASEVDIIFNVNSNLVGNKIIESIIISDNGDGFTSDNIASFTEYMTKKKANLGCKGIGRFTRLKVFKDVFISSFTETSKVDIKFSRFFDSTKDIIIQDKSSENDSKTGSKITFANLIGEYSYEELNLEIFKEKILDYFYVKFLGYKDKQKPFLINLLCENEVIHITSKDLNDLQIKSFTLESEINGNDVYTFDIKYCFVNNLSRDSECYLCGNGRLVENLKLDNLFSKLPQSNKIKVLVTSDYFDKRINDERTSFTFDKSNNNPTLDNPLSFPIISIKLQYELEQIILDKFPLIKQTNNEVVDECIKIKPYLAKYIKSDTSLIKDRKKVLENAEKEFEKDKRETTKNFLNILERKNIDGKLLAEEFSKINDLSSRELAQYFLFRQMIIDTLKKLNTSEEKYEAFLHKLFLNLGDSNTNRQEISEKYNNCIRLLDDKFMSYENMYSDNKIRKIKNDIKGTFASTYGDKEPDLTIFYSNKDAVVVEFKAIGANNTAKLSSYTEINTNISIVAQNFEDLNCIYGYIITKFSKEFIDFIKSQPGVKEMFSNSNYPIFYFYNDNIKNEKGSKIPAHIYILTTDNIYSDANARNKHFIDIIKNS